MKYLFAIALALSFNVTNTMYLEKLTPQQITRKRAHARRALTIFVPYFCAMGAACNVFAQASGLTDPSKDITSAAMSGALTGLTVAFMTANFTTDLLMGIEKD